ncbi:unnamed protein product, partial [marine sediment metagenome]
TNCIIYDVTAEDFKVDINVENDFSGVLYLGTSKYSMLKEFESIFSVNKYTFTVTGLSKETRYYFYIKNTSANEKGRTGIYSKKTTLKIPIIIDIGSPAVDRIDSIGGNITLVDKYNPANKNGTITKVEIFCPEGITNVRVASFFVVSGNNISTREYAIIGDVPAGYSEHVVSIGVQEGDFIGIYCGTGDIDCDMTGIGSWMKSENNIPCENKEFFYAPGTTISLHGTGTA